MTKEQMEQLLAFLSKELYTYKRCVWNSMEECDCDENFVTTPNDSDERALLKRVGRLHVKTRDALEAALTQYEMTGAIKAEG